MAYADVLQRTWENMHESTRESLMCVGLTPHPIDVRVLSELLADSHAHPEGDQWWESDPLLQEISERCTKCGGMLMEDILADLQRLSRCVNTLPPWHQWSVPQRAAAESLRQWHTPSAEIKKRKTRIQTEKQKGEGRKKDRKNT